MGSCEDFGQKYMDVEKKAYTSYNPEKYETHSFPVFVKSNLNVLVQNR